MWLSRSHVLSLILLSLSPLALSWYRQPDASVDNDNSYNAYPYTQSTDGYRDNPPPRFNTVPDDDSETRPASNPWTGSSSNHVQHPQSQFDYKELLDRAYGDTGTGLKCTKKLYVSPDHIIDIQSSVQYGAQLLDGVYAQSLDSCVQSCCDYGGCDLALYKTDGLSKSGKTCYFVHCGLPEHCRMVSNPGFTAGFLIEQPNYGDILDSHKPVTDFSSREHASESSSTEPVTTQPVTTFSTSALPTTETTPPQTTPSEATPPVTTPPEMTAASLTTQGTTSVSTEVETTERPDSVPTSSSPHSTLELAEEPEDRDNSSSTEGTIGTHSNVSSPSTTHTAPTIITTNESSSTKTKIDDNETIKHTSKDERDECSKNGCDGSGLIVVAIVGTLIIIVLLVVAVVITRRIYIIKTRKHYRNVDYLINGMYT